MTCWRVHRLIGRSECLVLLAALIAIPCAPQEPAAPETESARMAKAQEALKDAEAAHPGNTAEVAKALDTVIGLEMDMGHATEETVAKAKREMAVAEAAAGPRSKLFVAALTMASGVNVHANHASEGRALAERAFDIAQKEYPGTLEYINAANSLSFACDTLGDKECAIHADDDAVAAERKAGAEREWDMVSTLSSRADLRDRMGDSAGAAKDDEEALEIAWRTHANDPSIGILESNVATHYMRTLEFDKAITHYKRSIDIVTRTYGADSPMLQSIRGNIAETYTRLGQFDLAAENFQIAIANTHQTTDWRAWYRSGYARSLASAGNLPLAIKEGLEAARAGRESFVLQARTLPERQALAYSRQRPFGLNIALSVAAKHPDLVSSEIYQEVVRSRALVAEEMARRQRNLNANNDPEVARLLKEIDQARADLLATEKGSAEAKDRDEAIAQATARMEKIERSLAERSAAVRNDDREAEVRIEDVRRGLPAHSVLVSYVAYRRAVVENVDPVRKFTPAYLAFVLQADSDRISIFDLGDAKAIDDLVTSARASADSEAHAGGMGAARNERTYRQAAEDLRKLVWDPLQAGIGNARLVLVVPDGLLNLIPFSALPDGTGYLIEHGPVIHMLTSERDLVPTEGGLKKAGLLAVGNPSFDLSSLAKSAAPSTELRGGDLTCEQFRDISFHALPGSAAEVADVRASWARWNGDEHASLLTGSDATRARFIAEAGGNRVLHIATHAFVLDSSCGNGNPLLHSGLVFAGANQSREASILTAQQIASLDLSGVDWAVLSACNTGNGELRDGEGVLGLERAFRVAGARNVVMTLWPVDDDVTRRFMHELYAQILSAHADTADAAWHASQKLLLERRAAKESTHPWYWAGFVSSGSAAQ